MSDRPNSLHGCILDLTLQRSALPLSDSFTVVFPFADEGAASKSPEEMDGGRRSPQNPLGSAVDDIFKRIPSNNNSDDVSAMDALLSGCTAATRSSQGSNSSTENPIWPKLAANLFTPGIFVDPASNVWQPNSGILTRAVELWPSR